MFIDIYYVISGEIRTNWNIFGAIFQAVGAIATAAAVIVALWQTRFANKKRLRLSFSITGCIYGEDGVVLRYVVLAAANVGNRPVVIKQWGLILDKKHKTMIVNDPSDSLIKLVSTTLPHKILPEESIDLALRIKHLYQWLNKTLTDAPDLKKKTVKVYVVDSTGKVYRSKAEFNAREMLQKIEEMKKG